MTTEKTAAKRRMKQRHFAARELQVTIALFIVLALLGGIFLQSISSWFSSLVGQSPTVISIFLILGYAVIIIVLALLFSHRLVGPFKRLEYEMQLIARGNLGRRLSVRKKDDLYIRNFIMKVNLMIEELEELSREYNKMSSLVSTQLGAISMKADGELVDCGKFREDIDSLQRKIHEFRERW